ncbi:MAG: site-specific integrase, partial [Candidatus Nanopelagicales bacterium]|nr:site-specific integrase [Candidatus Nanopelagicales bacterium]
QLFTAWSDVGPGSIGLRPTTADQYKALIRTHIEPRLGAIRLEKLTKRVIADAMTEVGGSPSTRRSTYAALVKVLDYAVEQGLLAVNSAREVPRPRAAAPSRDQGIDQAGARRLLKAAEGDRLEVAAWLSYGCGLRRGEILGLLWSEVDLEAGVLEVTGNVTRSSAGLVRGDTKTRRGVRQVPIPPNVVAKLKDHRIRQLRERLAAGDLWVDSGHLLTTHHGQVLEPRNFSRVWSGWARVAKLSDTGTHTGRRYAATRLLASGRASVADVAAALGHDPSVLLNTYAVAVADGQRSAANALGASLMPDTKQSQAVEDGATDGATASGDAETG